MTLEERARAVVSEVCRLAGNYPNTAAVDAILSFARAAVAEERERAARVALDAAERHAVVLADLTDPVDRCQRETGIATAQGIARKIRELE